jgi:DNA-binding Xre family transcriptional regulator
MDDVPPSDDLANEDRPSDLHTRPHITMRARSELELRIAIVHTLRASGLAVEERVVCAAGEADIATRSRDVIIEVKHQLTRKNLHSAIGQVLLYRQAINPNARAIVIGYALDETAALVPYAAALGVEIICWQDRAGDRERSADYSSQPAAIGSPSFVLHWNIQSLAFAKGIAKMTQFSQMTGMPRQSLYGLWRGTAANVSIVMLERLAKRLSPTQYERLRPGDWFRWQGNQLVWNITAIAEQIGLDRAHLGFRAGLYPQALDLFWTGQAKFVFVETLARLAAALTTDDRPFDIGELFVRNER